VGENRLSGVHVLVLDDDEDIREVLSLTLAMAGAQTGVAASAAQARAVLQDFRPDIFLTDISMPGEDGIAFLASVRAMPHLRHVPAVAMTALELTPTLRARLNEAGFRALLAKPFGALQLEQLVAKLIGRT
jgi:CheY-like chemotaxis protein